MRPLVTISTTLAATLALVIGCGPKPAPPTSPAAEWFEDVTAGSGVRYSSDAGTGDPYYMPGLMGGGVALLDYDGDGRLDLFFTPGGEAGKGSPSKLYHQNSDGTFEDVTKQAGVEVFGYGQGVAVGDVNNDGRPDLFVTAYRAVWLFRNNGDGTFADVTQPSGVDNPQWATSAAFTDYDRDGWLDLVVVNYLEYNPNKTCHGGAGEKDFCGPKAYDGTVTRLFRNTGDGKFSDVTVKAGLAVARGPGLGVVCLDFDGDRWPDLFVANDGKPNHLWVNRRDGTFREEGVQRGVALNGMGAAEANMGIAVGDVDGNGLFDLFVTHLRDEQHRLWSQVKRGQFRDQTAARGLGGVNARSTGFGTLLTDFDHDGAEDLVVANGRVNRGGATPPAGAGEPFWTPYREGNHLYRNDGRGGFVNVTDAHPAFGSPVGVHRVVAAGDLDNDGAVDLVVTRVDGPARVYRNMAPARGHWVSVRAVDPALNRDAYGAELTVRAGDRRWTRWMNPGYSFACSNDPRAHVGLGSVEVIDDFRVVWPDGTEERFAGGPADRFVTLKKGTGERVEPSKP